MAVDKNAKKSTSAPYKGIPSNEGKPKAETKETDSSADLEEREELRNKYTQDIDEPVDNIKENPNRNRNKVDINKGKYN